MCSKGAFQEKESLWSPTAAAGDECPVHWSVLCSAWLSLPQCRQPSSQGEVHTRKFPPSEHLRDAPSQRFTQKAEARSTQWTVGTERTKEHGPGQDLEPGTERFLWQGELEGLRGAMTRGIWEYRIESKAVPELALSHDPPCAPTKCYWKQVSSGDSFGEKGIFQMHSYKSGRRKRDLLAHEYHI